jgi:hypothetical protein
LSRAQWDALKVELANLTAWDKQPWPSRATLRRVGRAAGKSHEAVRKWRLSPTYWRGLIVQARRQRLLSVDKEKNEIEPNPDREWALISLYTYLQKRWRDPLERNAIYEYVANRSDVIWIGDQERVLKGNRRSRAERRRRAKLQRWYALQSRGLMVTAAESRRLTADLKPT